MQLCLTPVGSLKASPPSALLRRTSAICRCQQQASRVSVPKATPKTSLAAENSSSFQFDANKSTLAAILLPVAAACAVFTACPPSVEAGILSGATGLESFELPSIPTPEVLKKIQEANVAKYKAFDENFKKSPFLQELLKKSKENEEKHKKEIADKYCERGAEWGVGDCSLVGLPQADKDAFFENLRKAREAAGQ
ncbi:unnamed protein product [Calypogeia fissa]